MLSPLAALLSYKMSPEELQRQALRQLYSMGQPQYVPEKKEVSWEESLKDVTPKNIED